MEESKETNKILKQILKLLAENEARMSADELTLESTKLLDKSEQEAYEATNKLQSTFDRIHDKMFSFNNMLIAAFLGLSKFPTDKPIFSLWVAILPILNLIYLMLLEKWQMEIYRHRANRMKWNFTTDVDKHGKMINKQNLRSFLSIITTFGLFLLLVIKILSY